MNKLVELAEKRIGRRKFLAGVGAAGAAATLAGCYSTGVNPVATVNYGYTNADYLNFALNLEYLEAEFYLRAATGQGLATADIGVTPGTVVGGAQITGLSTAQQNILNELAYDEQEHVRTLRTFLIDGSSGGTASGGVVSRPNLDLINSFVALATAANIPNASSFNPYLNFDTFLLAAFIFEDVGVTAYAGAVSSFDITGVTGPTNFLGTSASILAVESYHAALIRTTIVANTVAAGGAASYPNFNNANLVSTLRGTLGGGNETALTLPGGTTSAPTPTTIVPATTANAIAFTRTTDQIMHIVYGKTGVGVSQGGFFPNGLNGHITVTQS